MNPVFRQQFDGIFKRLQISLKIKWIAIEILIHILNKTEQFGAFI